MYNGNLLPSANTISVIFTHIFSLPDVFISTDIATSSSTVLFHDILKYAGGLLAFPFWLTV
jgi:hypothetical protein